MKAAKADRKRTFAKKPAGGVYSVEFKRELDRRYEDMLAGKNLISYEEVKENVQAVIRNTNKKLQPIANDNVY